MDQTGLMMSLNPNSETRGPIEVKIGAWGSTCLLQSEEQELETRVGLELTLSDAGVA